MIVVIEGPSAAGKSTWGRLVAPDRLVPETAELRPPSREPADAASFWVAANTRRWAAALACEARTGAAVCDTDPLKLHYDFGLLRIGRVSREVVDAGMVAYRAAVARRDIGIADLILCCVPDEVTLRRRQCGDHERRRRNFELHRQLSQPLAEWYKALDELDPGRVIWSFPHELPEVAPRSHYDLDLFDAWMTRLSIA